jgi:hypothetical protein
MKKALIVGLVLAFTAGLCLAANVISDAKSAKSEKEAMERNQVSQPSTLPPIYQEGKALLNEGFENTTFPPTGWQVINVLGVYQWVRSTTYAHSGVASAYISYQSTGGEDWLITPPLYPQSVNDSLKFWARKFFTANYPPDSLLIKVSTTDSNLASFTTTILAIEVNSLTASVWNYLAASLGAFNEQRIFVAFQHKDLDGNGVYIDDVTGPELTQPSFAHDLSLHSIDVPAGSYMAPEEVFTPTVTVKNRGLNPETNFLVVYQIDDGTKAVVYQDTVEVLVADTILPNQEIQYTFNGFIPQWVTSYNVSAWVWLDSDMNGANDTKTRYFRTFNELQGNVTDDNNGGAGLAGVKIKVTGPATDSTFTDASGDYFFFDLTAGTYTVTASKTGYNTETITGITVTDNMQTTLDLSMGYPLLTLTPTDSIYVTLPWGGADSTTWQFTLENTGTRDMDFVVKWPEASKGAKAPVSLVLDDGTVDNNIGIGGASEMIWVNRFTPAGGEFPFRLQQVQIWFSTSGNTAVGQSIQIVVYENTTGGNDPAVGSNLLYQYNTTIQAVDAWNVYDLPDEVLLNGPGDVVIGVINTYLPGSSYFPAALDQTASQQRSWAGWWTTPTHPEPPTLPPDNSWVLIDNYFPGNWMIRGYGETGTGNVAWLDVSPATGTVSPYNTENLEVTFNAAGLDSFTNWAAAVTFNTNAATGKRQDIVPAYLHVVGTGVSGGPSQPLSYAFGLNANRPNPVSGKTTFSFTLPRAQDYALKVYNIAGQQVASFAGKGQAGPNSVNWNTGKNGAGVYFYQLASGGMSATRKLVVLR